MTIDNLSHEPRPMIVIWDPIVRFGHWILVAAFALAYLTGDEMLELHEWSGYVVAAYVALRLAWGIIGSKHARFADFLYGPRRAVSYLADLVHGQARRYLGHSPSGSMMVFALLIMLTGTVTTGMAELAASHGEGPFIAILQGKSPPSGAPYNLSNRPAANEDSDESALREAHELFANFTLALVVFHIIGVIAASVIHRENLIASMFTGRKRP